MIQITVFLLGFTAMVSQIVLVRELIVVFYGNEISVGFILAGWLIWTAFGSWGLGRFADRAKSGKALFSFCQLLLSASLPLSIIAARAIKLTLNVSPGEVIGPIPIIVCSFFIVSIVCCLLGFMFTLACKVYPDSKTKQREGAIRIGKVYVIEALGATTGGLLASFVLIRLFDSISIMMSLSILNLILAVGLLSFKNIKGFKTNILKGLVVIMLIGGLFLLFTGKVSNIEKASLDLQWKNYQLLESKNSIYSNIAVTKQFNQISFFNNGLHLFTVPDELQKEESVHFTLSQQPKLNKVLLVGGGVGGLLEEILKHPVKQIDYVELDPLVIELARRFLGEEEREFLYDARVRIINTDGRFFIKQTKKATYDCIILNISDPFTAQLNRFYTKEFFQEVKLALSEGGVLSFGVTSSEHYIGKELNMFLGCLHKTLGEVFSDVKVIPGETAYFLAAKQEGILSNDYRLFVDSLRRRNIQTKFVREYYLFSKLSDERIAYIEDKLSNKAKFELNTDFKPVCYYYDMVLWASYFSSYFQKAFSFISKRGIWFIAGIFYFLILLSSLFVRNVKNRKKGILLAIATTGFAEIVFQIVVILAFQIIYGFLYYKIGLILTSFMIGLSLGGFYATSILDKLKNQFKTFIHAQVCICLYPLVLPLIFFAFAPLKNQTINWLGSNIVFPFLPIIAGFIGGFQFPLANKIYLSRSNQVAKVAGLSYCVDLLGACLGAVLASAILLPILGIPYTCLAVALLNAAVLVHLLLLT